MKLGHKPVVMDFDDLCDNTRNKLDLVAKLKESQPNLKVTLFTIPARCSPSTIQSAKSLGEWVSLGMHGWRHTTGECWGWTKEDAINRMKAAFDMGIDGKVFRAPKWILDVETYLAAAELGWVIADHKDWRILGTDARTYTYNQSLRNPPWIRVHGHLPNVSGNGIEDYFYTYQFPEAQIFKFITEIV